MNSQLQPQDGTALKERTWELMEVGEQFGPVFVTITEDLVDAYAFAVQDFVSASDSSGGQARFGHPTLLCRDARDVLKTAYDLQSGGSGLHAKSECRIFGRPKVGETVTVTGHFTEKFIKRDKQYVVLESEVRGEAGNLILWQRDTNLRGLKKGVAKEPAGSRERRAPTIVSDRTVTTFESPVAIGAQLSPIHKAPTQEHFSAFAIDTDTNIHNDLATATAAGLPTTVASGLQAVGYMSELMYRYYPDPWLRSGHLSVAFTLPIYLGDDIYVSAQIRERHVENEKVRIAMDIWCENQFGERVAVGTSSVLLPPDTPAIPLEGETQ